MFSRLFSWQDTTEKPPVVKKPARPQLRAVPAPNDKPKQPIAITKKEELPQYQSVLNAEGGPLESRDPRRRSIVAALEFEPGKAGLVINKDALSDAYVFSLIDALGRKGYRIVAKYSASVELVMELYDSTAAVHERRRADIFQGESPDSVKFFEELVALGLRKRATDLHIEIRERTGLVRYRIDGIIDDYRSFPSTQLGEAVSVAYMKLADQKSRSHSSFNRDLEQDCVIELNVLNRTVRLRYQQIPGAHGVDYVIRLLLVDHENKVKSLVELGYLDTQRQMLQNAVKKTAGAIIIAGVTGSGKSTTLQTLMSMLPSYLKKFSVEDPVEYRMPGVTQISVQRSARDSTKDGVSVNPFVAAMRVLMRGDPDVIMVGEIRDHESGSIAKTMIQTGHELMSTVHASSAPGIIPRMCSEEIGLSREVLGSPGFLSALVYQRLIPKLCEHCKEPALGKLPDHHAEILVGKFGLDLSTMFVAKEHGCQKCGSKHGVLGQTILSEIIMPTSKICELIVDGRDAEMIRYWRGTRRSGFDDPDTRGKTAFEHGLYLVSIGVVDPLMLEDSFESFDTYEVFEMGAY